MSGNVVRSDRVSNGQDTKAYRCEYSRCKECKDDSSLICAGLNGVIQFQAVPGEGLHFGRLRMSCHSSCLDEG